MNEDYAKRALRELGITRASRSNAEYQALIDAYMRADEANQKLEDEAELAEAQAKWDRDNAVIADDPNHDTHEGPYSKSGSSRDDKSNLGSSSLAPSLPRPVVPSILRPVVPPKPRSDGRKRGSSKSTLAPILHGEGALVRRREAGKRGRPRVIAVWMPDVAAVCADGMPLKAALEKHSIQLDSSQLRALQRSSAFRELRQQARRDRRNQRGNSQKPQNSCPDGALADNTGSRILTGGC
jgi:hypothetical protein